MDYDLDTLLNYQKAALLKDSNVPLYTDRTAIIEWVGIPAGSVEECRKLLESQRMTITDVTVGFNKLEGIYRFSKLEYFDGEDGGKIQAHYRASFYATWDWTRVELGTPSHFDTNTNFAILRHRHIDPTKSAAFAASSPSEFTDQVTNIGTFSGTWKRGRTRMIQDEDGSGIALMYVAREGINVALYDANTENGGADVYTSHDDYAKGYTDYYYGLVDPNYTGLVIGASPYEQTPGFTYKKTVSRSDETCLYDVVIEKSAGQYVAVYEQSNYSGFLKSGLYETIDLESSKNAATRPVLPTYQ